MNENLRKMKDLIAFLNSPRLLLVIQSSEAAPPTLEGSFEIVSVTSVEFHNFIISSIMSLRQFNQVFFMWIRINLITLFGRMCGNLCVNGGNQLKSLLNNGASLKLLSFTGNAGQLFKIFFFLAESCNRKTCCLIFYFSKLECSLEL